MLKKFRKITALLLAVAMISTAVAGCGCDNSGTIDATTTTTGSSATTTPPTSDNPAGGEDTTTGGDTTTSGTTTGTEDTTPPSTETTTPPADTTTTTGSTAKPESSETTTTTKPQTSTTTTTATTTKPQTTTTTQSVPSVPGVIADNAVDFAANLKLGWNLGNTLDATGSGLNSETSWGQPKTTKELINYVKSLGFTSIRIPITWSNHVDADYNIDEAWMDRVNEVVDYAIDAGFYVIINSHHDSEIYFPSDEKYAQASKYIEKIWTQIGTRFKDYDKHLVFESMNEPRLVGTDKEWWFSSNDPDGIEAITCVAKLNQVFVDTVRKTGGNNGDRFLMVPSVSASADNALNSSFYMPTDTAKSRLILSVHAYTPYNFAMNYGGGYKGWAPAREKDLNFMNKLKTTFIDKGYGVVIGEFGATNKDNLAERIEWAEAYTRIAQSNKISCVIWDNGGTKVGDENFGLVNRRTLEVYYPDYLAALLQYYK